MNAQSETSGHRLNAVLTAKEAMFPYHKIENVNVGEFIEEHECYHRESLLEEVDLELCDPTCNVRRVQNDEHSPYDRLSTVCIEDVAQLFGSVMKRGGHRHMFCTFSQIRQL